jgi:predicted ArsR family transcriptional regulator
MSSFDPSPSDTTLAAEHDEWRETQDTRTRIQGVITGCQEPVTAAVIADRAQCSTNAARKHLTDLVDLGIARKIDDEATVRYARNDAYFRWRRANELATTATVEELLDELDELETRDTQFKTQFDADAPSDVTLPDDATHGELEARLQTLSEWQTVRDSIDRHRAALRIARQDGDRLTV